MTHPMSQHWKQPAVDDIILNVDRALMTHTTLCALAEYSCTFPSGVYPGKMWRRAWDYYERTPERWVLCWWEETEGNPDSCTVNSMEITVVPQLPKYLVEA